MELAQPNKQKEWYLLNKCESFAFACKGDTDWKRFRETVDRKLCLLPDISDGNGNACTEALAHILIAAANEVFPVKNNNISSIPSPPCWDSECTEAIGKRKEA